MVFWLRAASDAAAISWYFDFARRVFRKISFQVRFFAKKVRLEAFRV